MSQTFQFPTKEEQLKALMLGGMYLGFVGETGSGKTTSITWFGYHLNKTISKIPDMKIYANYHLLDVPNEGLIWDWEFMHHPDELLELPRFSIALLDDMWRWCLDSYKNKSKIMTKYDEIQSSGRKRGYMILASLQRFMRIDPNFRINVQYIIQPTMWFDTLFRPYKITLVVVDNHTGLLEGLPFDIDPSPVFDMFDTTEEIKPLGEQDNLKTEELAEQFMLWNVQEILTNEGKKILINQKVTQDLVNLFLAKNNLYDYMTKDERAMLKVEIVRIQKV